MEHLYISLFQLSVLIANYWTPKREKVRDFTHRVLSSFEELTMMLEDANISVDGLFMNADAGWFADAI
ncbi:MULTISPECIES: hypothetical protein [unclassified Arcicella]|uniref:hypothetical protein n=1 Tax=unclassified Arcicella TaxID=2644986 RepID=UPI00285723C2|nr:MULTISPECIES: hypothetical protein [unclassified Arcicella]MDR6561281.1 hypothetical protein [Arcicella sp. BE51]MDR6811165.1 hypothetical protein [Arcicella sp. BE140]MDR6822515.1 hypothetical protein [Arcicella sp. BE139]